MVVFDESGSVVESPDESLGEVSVREKTVVHRWVVDEGETGHWETVAEYDNGGRDVEWVVDSPERGHWETLGEDGGLVEHYDGAVADDWPHDSDVRDVWTYGVYHAYTEDELAGIEERRQEQEAEAEKQRAIADGSAEFFAGGGREAMQQQIDASASSGTNPQLATFAALALAPMAASLTDEQAMSVSTLWPEWSPDSVPYKVDDVRRYGGGLYRCEQDHVSQTSWTPDAAPSLWSRIEVAGDGIDVWTQPTGAHNAYDKGDRVHYPDASGPVYVSTIDGNVWAPDAYPAGWQLEEG